MSYSPQAEVGLSTYRDPGALVATILKGVSDPSPDAREHARAAARQLAQMVTGAPTAGGAATGGALEAWLGRFLASPEHVQTFIRAVTEGRAGRAHRV